MTRRFAPTPTRTALATTLAAALALTTASTAPARAGNEDVGAIAALSFLALVTAGVIASAQTSDRVPAYQPLTDTGHDHIRPDPVGPHYGAPRADPRKILPPACQFDLNQGRDRGTWYGSRCLEENFVYWPYLPDRCEQSVDLPGRWKDVNAYDAQCLAHFGYRPADDRAAYR